MRYMRRNTIRLLTLVLFVVLFVVYYFFQFGTVDQTEVFLSIATFLFAIFSGFLMSRQAARYSEIRRFLARFDGFMSALYRNTQHISPKAGDEVKKILRRHYRKQLSAQSWDWYFEHKSSTLTDIHAVLEKESKKQGKSTVRAAAVKVSIGALQQLQITRKELVNLHLEHVPAYQWALIGILGIILLLTVSAAPSTHAVIPALLKSAFGTSVLIVWILLYELDNLQFFESNFGERSARDVLDILAGRK